MTPNAAATRAARRQAMRRPAMPARGVPGRALRVAIVLCYALSLLLSFKAWITHRDYPVVPVIRGMPTLLPASVDLALYGTMLAALVLAAVMRRARIPLLIATAIGLLWMLLDRNRWQPYVAFYLVALACLADIDGRSRDDDRTRWSLVPFQLFVCCMYVYSGLNKFNRNYLETAFLSLNRPALRWLHLDPAAVPAGVAITLAVGSAAVEFVGGILLIAPRTRRAGVVLLTLMHAYILLLIGPLGSSTNRVVWPWNIAAIAALWLLFWRPDPRVIFTAWLDGTKERRGVRIACALVLLVFGVLPAFSFAGRWDGLMSFQMYAGRQPLAWLHYDPSAADSLPPTAAGPTDLRGQVSLNGWAMRELNLSPPLEPAVAVAVAREIARRAPAANLRLLLAMPPGVFSGRREARYFEFKGPDAEPVDLSQTAGIVLPPGL